MVRRDLLSELVQIYVAQPATALWRAVEIEALLRLGLPEGRGLDLGCGDGKLTNIILGQTGPRRLVGADPDAAEADAATRSGIYEKVVVAPGNQIPEPDASFDFVLSNSVLEHIPELEPVLSEVGRVLRPGGRFLFTVPAPGFHRNLYGSRMPWVHRSQYLSELDLRLAHHRYPTPSEWQTLCASADLSLDGCLGYLDRNQTQRWETFSRYTGGLLYALWGKRQPPIKIQRQLGLRAVQNTTRLPRAIANIIGGCMALGLPSEGWIWLAETDASCLLVHGTRKVPRD